MEKSEDIKDLATALALAQGEMKGAIKDSSNPFYKSKYSDLASVFHAIGQPFAKNGLSVVQTTSEGEKGTMLHTTLLHKSGQWISSAILVKPVKNDPQGLGSALSYYRRYSLCAIAGVYSEDDDGNAASGKSTNTGAVVIRNSNPAKAYFDPITDEDQPPYDAFPDESPSTLYPGLQSKDQTFTIGKEMKGKKFSEQLKNPSFVHWAKSEVENNLAKCHAQLKDFYDYAKERGVIK